MSRQAHFLTRRVFSLLILTLALFVLVAPAAATEVREGGNITIPAGEVIADDLIISGNLVVVDGDVEGDLIITGGQEVTVNGRVGGNLFLAGQTLTVNGPVAGSMAAGGLSLTLGEGAQIGGSLYFGGFSLTTSAGSAVARNLYAGNYQSILDGNVGRDAQIGAAALELNGIIAGDLTAEVGAAAETATPPFAVPGVERVINPGFRQGAAANVGGQMAVTVSQPQPDDVTTTTTTATGWLGLPLRLLDRVGEFIALLLVGALVFWLMPGWTERIAAEVRDHPGPSLGWGVVWAVIFPVIVIAALIVLIVLAIALTAVTFGHLGATVMGLGGAGLGLSITVFSFVALTMSKVIVALLVGQLLLRYVRPEQPATWSNRILGLAVGALIYELLRAIPFAGALLALVVILVGLGASYLAVRGRRELMLKPFPAEPKVAM